MAGVNRYFQRQIGAYNPVVRPLPFQDILQAGMLKQQGLNDARVAGDQLESEMLLKAGRATEDLARYKNQYYQGAMAKLAAELDDPNESYNSVATRMRKLNSEFAQDASVQAIKEDFALLPIATKTEVDPNFVSGNFESEHYDVANKRWNQLTEEDINNGVSLGASRYAPVYGTSLDEDYQPIIDQIKPDVMSAAFRESGLKEGEYDIINGKVHVYDESKSSKYRELTRKKLAEKLGEYIYGDDTPLESSDKASVRFKHLRSKRLGEQFGKDELFNEVMRIAQLGEFSEEYTTDKETSKSIGSADGRSGTSKKPVGFWDGSTVAEIGADPINSRFAFHDIKDVFSLSRAVSDEGIAELTNKVFEGSRFNADGTYKKGGASVLEDGAIQGDLEEYNALVEEAQHDAMFLNNYLETQKELFTRKTGKDIEEIIAESADVLQSADDYEEMIMTQALELAAQDRPSTFGAPAYNPPQLPADAFRNPNAHKQQIEMNKNYREAFIKSPEYKKYEKKARQDALLSVSEDLSEFNRSIAEGMEQWSSFKVGMLLSPKSADNPGGNPLHNDFLAKFDTYANTLDVGVLRGAGAMLEGDETLAGMFEGTNYGVEDFKGKTLFMADDDNGKMQWYLRGRVVPQTGKNAAELPSKFEGAEGFLDVNVTDLMDDVTGMSEVKMFNVAGAIRDAVYTSIPGDEQEIVIPGIRTNPDSKLIIKSGGPGGSMVIKGNAYLNDEGTLREMDIMDAYEEMTGRKSFASPEEASEFVLQLVETSNLIEAQLGDSFDVNNFDENGIYNQPSIDESGLGSLSAKYESRGSATAIGRDNTGGYSYGKYQIATNTGTFKEYMDYLQTANPDAYGRLVGAGGAAAAKAGSKKFDQAWKEVMSNEDVARTQHGFIKTTHYNPTISKLKKSVGFNADKYSGTVHDVIWSTSVQHGASGAASIIKKAIENSGKTASTITEAELIRAIYKERSRRDSDGLLHHFRGSTAAVQDSVANRFAQEQAEALSAIS